jgi:hypothetical protein
MLQSGLLPARLQIQREPCAHGAFATLSCSQRIFYSLLLAADLKSAAWIKPLNILCQCRWITDPAGAPGLREPFTSRTYPEYPRPMDFASRDERTLNNLELTQARTFCILPPLRWGVAAQNFGMSSRQYRIRSRLFEQRPDHRHQSGDGFLFIAGVSSYGQEKT